MFLENFTKFIKYFGRDKYLQLTGFTGLSLIAGFLEFVGIALIYPFILLIINPEALSHFKFIKINNSLTGGLMLGLGVLFIFIGKNAFIIFTQYVQSKFTNNWRHDICNRFMKLYLYSPYKLNLQSPAGSKLYLIENICGQVIDGFVIRALNLLTNTIIILMIILLLLIKFPAAALATIIFVCLSMYLQNKFFKSKTHKISQIMDKRYKNYKNSLLENINNIKEIKILSSEKIFYNNFYKNSSDLKAVQINYNFYSAIPPYIVEILVVSSLLVMACILSLNHSGSNSDLVASFAIVVAALFRIAPALNRVQTSIININSSKEFVKRLNEEYEQYDLEHFKEPADKQYAKMNFNKKIRLEKINFSYNKSKQVLKNITFEINKGDFIGIIGLSGAGKSTLADIITGLLPPDSGTITVDNTLLTEKNYPQFRRILGYVPQQINILDKSIKENVAWGCKNINEEGVIKALKAAQLYDVLKDYPEGINANIIIGSNGLSQGQKQRLALARALYRDPEIIILDEATSALDVQVENEITEMLKQISKSKTIIAIAHRLSTLKACNKLIYIKNGQLIDIGSFNELSCKYPDFATLVQLSSIK